MFARFSTVAGEQGFPDTVRDPRGFALKFYTEEGNYDLVGNNTPVFFVRDATQVPGLHPLAEAPARHRPALQRHAVGLLDAVARERPPGDDPDVRPRHAAHLAAHERLRQPHVLVDERRRRAVLGQVPLQDRPGRSRTSPTTRPSAMAGEDPDFHRRDLCDAIAAGDAPEWRLEMQIMPFEEAADYRFNPFDLTKVWPHADYPPIQVGRMVLDRNPENFFAEVEQAAFSPVEPRARDRPEPRQDADGPDLLLPRHPPAPDRRQLRAAADQRAEVAGALLQQGRPDDLPPRRRRSRCTRRTPTAARRPTPSTGADLAGTSRRARSAATPTSKHAEDDDFVQPGTLYRDVMDDDRPRAPRRRTSSATPATTSPPRCRSA